MKRTAILTAAMVAAAGMTCLTPGAWALTNCSAGSLNTSYSVKLTGTVGRLPLSGAGVLSFDGIGTVSGVMAFSRDFNVFQNVSANGSYSVNSNCTGTLDLSVNLGNGSQHYIIAVNSTGFVGIQVDGGTSVTLDARP